MIGIGIIVMKNNSPMKRLFPILLACTDFCKTMHSESKKVARTLA